MNRRVRIQNSLLYTFAYSMPLIYLRIESLDAKPISSTPVPTLSAGNLWIYIP